MGGFLYENHRYGPLMTLLNSLSLLGVLNVLYVLNMPKDASLAYEALLFFTVSLHSPPLPIRSASYLRGPSHCRWDPRSLSYPWGPLVSEYEALSLFCNDKLFFFRVPLQRHCPISTKLCWDSTLMKLLGQRECNAYRNRTLPPAP